MPCFFRNIVQTLSLLIVSSRTSLALRRRSTISSSRHQSFSNQSSFDGRSASSPPPPQPAVIPSCCSCSPSCHQSSSMVQESDCGAGNGAQYGRPNRQSPAALAVEFTAFAPAVFASLRAAMGISHEEFLAVGAQCVFSMLFSKHWSDYIRKSWLHPSAVNVCNRGKGGTNPRNFLFLQFLLAVVPAVLS